MQSFYKLMLAFFVVFVIACEKSTEVSSAGTGTDIPDCANEYFGLYVGPPCAIPSAEFFSINAAESKFRLDANEVWFLEDGFAAYGDTSVDISYCEDERFYVCILEPIPFLLPKNIASSFSVELQEKSFQINVEQLFSEKYKKDNFCEYKSFKFEVIDENNQVYTYSVFKNYGLKHYSIKYPDASYQTEMHNVMGSIFAYEEFCE